jgi:hypothetical protein
LNYDFVSREGPGVVGGALRFRFEVGGGKDRR